MALHQRQVPHQHQVLRQHLVQHQLQVPHQQAPITALHLVSLMRQLMSLWMQLAQRLVPFAMLLAPNADCPTDTPGGNAKPRCNLQDSDTGAMACGLACGPLKKCPSGSSCSGGGALGGGVCYWPETSNAVGRKHAKQSVTV